MERLAIAAAEAVGAAIAGVDLIVTMDGAPTVLEVNSMPAWNWPANGQRVQHRRGDRARSRGRIGPPAGATVRPMNGGENRVAAAYIEACLAELDAPKPGNVHRFAPGHEMSVHDFVRSAEASAGPIAARRRPRGRPHSPRRRSDPVGGRPEHQPRHHTLVRAARGGDGKRACRAASCGGRRA